MRKVVRIIVVTLLSAASVLSVLFVWLLPRITVQVNSPLAGIFLTDHSSDSLVKPFENGISEDRVEEFSFITDDGLRLSAFKVSSVDSAVFKGSIFFLHGIRRMKEQSFPMAAYFSKRGYDCYAMDMRSHGESEGRYITYGHLEKGDLIQLLDYVESQYGIKGKVILWGQSLGAAVALMVASEERRVDCVVSESSLLEEYPELQD